jgi:hypothetical protein
MMSMVVAAAFFSSEKRVLRMVLSLRLGLKV